MKTYMLVADVARVIGRVPATVKDAANAGRLKVAARTLNGTRLFLAADVEEFKRSRANPPRCSRQSTKAA